MLATGDEVESVQWQLWLRCHATFKSTSVLLMHLLTVEWEWHKIRSHILGVWHHMNLISVDLHSLHHEISDIQNVQLDMIDPPDLAKQVLENLKGFNPFNMLKDTLWCLLALIFAVTVLFCLILVHWQVFKKSNADQLNLHQL